jgi:hypothetical protein
MLDYATAEYIPTVEQIAQAAAESGLVGARPSDSNDARGAGAIGAPT